jgi:hypothetical protein
MRTRRSSKGVVIVLALLSLWGAFGLAVVMGLIGGRWSDMTRIVATMLLAGLVIATGLFGRAVGRRGNGSPRP